MYSKSNSELAYQAPLESGRMSGGEGTYIAGVPQRVESITLIGVVLSHDSLHRYKGIVWPILARARVALDARLLA